jgi:hypothetical protein
VKLFCRKGDLIRLLVPTISAWQGIGIAAEKVYDDGDPDTVVPFFKQDQPLDDQVPSIALIGDVELISPTNREIDRLMWQSEQNPQGYRELVREFLARWGTPQPPAAGEVAAALIELRSTVMGLGQMGMYVAAQRVERAADLLQRHHPQPVPVSERLPGPEDWDGDGRCWIFMPDIGTDPSWRLTDPRDIGPYHTHYLPANALPNPEDTNA